MKGILKKYSRSTLIHGWTDRYVVLKNKTLKYYKSINSKVAMGVLNFDHFEITIEKDKKDETYFKLHISGINNIVFDFKTDTKEHAHEWYEAILGQIKISNGFKNQLNASEVSKPWKFDNLSEN